jgi:hypothetical protein
MSPMSTGVRVVLLLVGATVAAMVIASSAAASVGRPPDVRDAADVFGRYAAAHTYGVGLPAGPVTPPDVRDAAAALRETAPPSGGSFHWGDYAAGVGTGIASALILAGFLAAVAARRSRLSTA